VFLDLVDFVGFGGVAFSMESVIHSGPMLDIHSCFMSHRTCESSDLTRPDV